MKKYPIGIQTFSEIIRKGYVYVDKTGLIHQLVSDKKYVFLSRPRRFGKSLLSSTLHSYFRGEKDLFAGLQIEALEKEWKTYPVLHFDFSTAKNHSSIEEIRKELLRQIAWFEEQFQLKGDKGQTPGQRLDTLIRHMFRQTGEQAVVIIDEYDAPMLDALHNETLLADIRLLMQEFYAPLKPCDPYLRFVFITGITKFSQLSIFSIINNLKNISMSPQYAALCGITEKELLTIFSEDIACMANENDCTPEEMHHKLKEQFDGYHFTRNSEDIYNPFSLLNAFDEKAIGSYWFATGTPTYLIRQLQRFRTDITSLDDIQAPASAFDRPTEAMTDALPLLYQSGYLTIKGYDSRWDTYHLALPNKEVRIGLMENLLPMYTQLSDYQNQGFIRQFCQALDTEDINAALTALRAYMAGIPYTDGMKAVLDDVARSEGFYEYLFYILFSCMNQYVRTQVRT
ncbi:MAG: AAA family ATPase, partial [Bacteroidaceae bacterium]|nr:AAA family ATPase [Bacteroidaceae bacterium]